MVSTCVSYFTHHTTNTKGILLSPNIFPSHKLNLVRKHETFHYLQQGPQGLYWVSPLANGDQNLCESINTSCNPILKVKYWEFLELLCQEMGTKRRQQVRVYGHREDIREYGYFFPFLRVFKSDVKESCALVELDGEEQLVPMEQIHKKSIVL